MVCTLQAEQSKKRRTIGRSGENRKEEEEDEKKAEQSYARSHARIQTCSTTEVRFGRSVHERDRKNEEKTEEGEEEAFLQRMCTVTQDPNNDTKNNNNNSKKKSCWIWIYACTETHVVEFESVCFDR